jgi:hypothetical protein
MAHCDRLRFYRVCSGAAAIGFHSFGREAVTALAQEIGLSKAMKAAEHSKAELTLVYPLDDFDQHAAGIMRFLGSPERSNECIFAAKGAERAKRSSADEEIATLT